MANSEHLKILKRSVQEWNQWRKDNPDVMPRLSGAYLIDAKLGGADLSGAYLSDVRLGGADLSGTKLRKANLERAEICEPSVSRIDASNRKSNQPAEG